MENVRINKRILHINVNGYTALCFHKLKTVHCIFQLYMPNKVEIPERYMPESDEEEITVEEQMRREEKAEKIKQILTKQTLG